MGSGTVPRDDNGAPVLALWNDATGQAVPLHASAIVTGADGKKYALLDIGLGGVAPGLDNTNELRVSLYGKNVAAGDTPFAVDVAGRLLTANYIGGAAVGNLNPYPSADQVRLLILAGQGFSATTGVLSSATNGNLYGGMGLFNNATAKNMLIYSILLSVSNNAFDSRLNLTSADPAMGSALTAYNLSPGGAASLATLSAPANNFTASVGITGNSIEAGGAQANSLVEWLQNGACILLPKNAANGIAVYTKMVTAGNSFCVTTRWVEY